MSLDDVFPRLRNAGYRTTSPSDIQYNCIAWAAGDQDRWWWPDQNDQYYWPPTVLREETIDAFVEAYETLGFIRSNNDALEPGFEKVALYALEGKPKHAARQLNNGVWTSKLGGSVDIEHTLEGLVGPLYGVVVQLLKRSIAQ